MPESCFGSLEIVVHDVAHGSHCFGHYTLSADELNYLVLKSVGHTMLGFLANIQ